jgi:hypothetical protein
VHKISSRRASAQKVCVLIVRAPHAQEIAKAPIAQKLALEEALVSKREISTTPWRAFC